MRLKSLEIKGFKSFADKTHIILDNPITGIVGPNGCGKSNIVDAIRWVIGEHKIKSLRSDNLEDLIFNGSRTRAASGLAEVSLTFENTRNLLPTDFTMVTITRKFYKNGESEYRLNDVSCRLKDIHNLFLDTGVSNDSYAIIELGMVDDIIKDKDGARRRMLEQAAGISIYKTRKKEAKQKLELTEQDISRIEDLLFEISNNLRTLESQAKKAEKYFAVKAEYKEVSIELAKASLENFNDQYKNLTNQLDAETDRKTNLDAIVAAEESSVESQKLLLIQREQELNGLQKQFNAMVNQLRQLENDKKLAAQKSDHLKEREKNLKDFLAGAGGQAERYEESISLSEKQIADETFTLETLKKELEALKQAVEEKRKDFEAKKKVLEQLRNEYQVKQRSQFDAEKKAAIAETSITNLQRSMQQVQDDKAQRVAQIAQIKTETKDTEGKLGIKKEELIALLANQQEIKTNILKSQEQMEQLRSKLAEENRKLDARRNEHDLLKSLVDSLEGYPDSIKFLKKNKDWNATAPLLSDVFVVNNEYRTALENVLDSYLNYYLVANAAEAAKAVSLLVNNKKGKANFFLLDAISTFEPEIPVEVPNAISALSVVTVDEQYAKLANRLLGHVYIINEGETNAHIPDFESIVLVDKSGKTVRGKYFMGGGSIGLFEGNKIGRAKNLERLALDIQGLNTVTNDLKKSISEAQSKISALNASLNDRAIELTKQEINRLQNLCINLASKAENFEHLNNSSEKRIADIQKQIDDTHQNIHLVRADMEQVTAVLATLQQSIQDAESDFRSVDLGYNEVSQKYNQQNIAYTRQHSKLDTLRQELRFRNNQLNDLKRQIASNKEQLALVGNQLEETTKLIETGATELYNLLQRKETDERKLNETDRAYYQLRNETAAKESNLNQKRREKGHSETILLGIKEQINAMKLKVAGMSERLAIEFKVKLDDILDQPRESAQSVDELTADCEKMKKRLDNMGEINPTAIEAYSEIKVRHDFINVQKKDLVDAKESLMKTIEEVENTANTKFSETFNLVRENFVTVFKALFTSEDNCNLSLTDPDNLAESNIEIYAQPKGKKPSTLTQLSGGEKTLTSTAFLFAIYLIKPAPFCILDEVDAPLDDANVGKFTQMIRKFSDNSQFIIVTHNKQTMASVDVIYGVTMQEAGVSKLVPVDFRSLN